MYKKYLVTLILTSICQVFIGQVDFYQDNNIIVSKNNMELNNAWAGGMNFCQFSKIDLNLDGYDDLFIFDRSGKNGTVNGNKIIPFVFDNNLNEYIYSPSYIDLFPDLQDWVLLVDYNQDNKVDIFTSSNSSIAVYTNTSENILSFEYYKMLTSDAGFGQTNVYVSSSDIPAIADIDGDTDIDILTFDPSGSHLYLHENKSMQMSNNNDSINLVRSDNCWGRFREEFSTNSVTLNLDSDCNEVEDDGRNAHSGSTVLALDIDPENNQGLEVLLGDITYNNMVMLYNGGSNSEALIIDQDSNFPSYNTPINITRFPGAFLLDVDNDNLEDLIISPNGVNVSENHKNSIFYKNTGTSVDNNTQFEFMQNDFLIEDMLDVGTNSAPILYDLNNDSLLDLIIGNKGYFENGNYNSRISLYQNTGTASNPSFEFVTEDFSNLSDLGDLFNIQALCPTFGDLDDDQDIDMIIGDNNGQIYYFENTLQNNNDFPVFNSYELLDIDVGSFATPQLIDLNRDGLLDLVIGERMGIDNGVYNGVNYYQNTGSENEAVFENYTPEFMSGDYDENGNEIITKSLGGIHLSDPVYLTGYTNPYVFEHNEKYYLAVGTESGLVYLYDNVENSIGETLSLNLETEYSLITNSMLDVNNCVHSKITITDIDNDSTPDLIRGNASGGLELYWGENFNIQTALHTIDNNIEITPNPNNGFFTIKTSQYINNTLSIYSILGHHIMDKNIEEKITEINLNNYEKGIYILHINNLEKPVKERIIIH